MDARKRRWGALERHVHEQTIFVSVPRPTLPPTTNCTCPEDLKSHIMEPAFVPTGSSNSEPELTQPRVRVQQFEELIFQNGYCSEVRGKEYEYAQAPAYTMAPLANGTGQRNRRGGL
ncbi:hypothetical protein C8J57DRAFT_1231800 [Mycena rebaudengoi]|nr:hypothetical protein C8J57DRAFT_1231800 [Mycena rebaudengoi]